MSYPLLVLYLPVLRQKHLDDLVQWVHLPRFSLLLESLMVSVTVLGVLFQELNCVFAVLSVQDFIEYSKLRPLQGSVLQMLFGGFMMVAAGLVNLMAPWRAFRLSLAPLNCRLFC